MMGSLSVRENLQFSAALRLPSHTTRQQRRERVERVIEELGLQSCANTKVRVGCGTTSTPVTMQLLSLVSGRLCCTDH